MSKNNYLFKWLFYVFFHYFKPSTLSCMLWHICALICTLLKLLYPWFVLKFIGIIFLFLFANISLNNHIRFHIHPFLVNLNIFVFICLKTGIQIYSYQYLPKNFNPNIVIFVLAKFLLTQTYLYLYPGRKIAFFINWYETRIPNGMQAMAIQKEDPIQIVNQKYCPSLPKKGLLIFQFGECTLFD